MPEYIKSTDGALHIVHRGNSSKYGRTDLVDESEFLQVSMLKHNTGKSFSPHIHIEKQTDNLFQITQECWIVIKGSVLVNYYDTQGCFITSRSIFAGDCSITIAGGHSYEILDENTVVYECKTGPYYGVEKDKVFINE